MPIDFHTLMELSKITSQIDENSVLIEQNLMQKGSFENTTPINSRKNDPSDGSLLHLSKFMIFLVYSAPLKGKL